MKSSFLTVILAKLLWTIQTVKKNCTNTEKSKLTSSLTRLVKKGCAFPCINVFHQNSWEAIQLYVVNISRTNKVISQQFNLSAQMKFNL